MATEKQLIEVSVARGYAESLIADPILKMAVNAVLNKTPRVDAVEVVHGRWEKFGYDFRCSACGVYQCGHYIGMTNYCPNCGAKMEGETGSNGRPAV